MDRNQTGSESTKAALKALGEKMGLSDAAIEAKISRCTTRASSPSQSPIRNVIDL
jgi:hypothetical protein